jgi:hypothetical protein
MPFRLKTPLDMNPLTKYPAGEAPIGPSSGKSETPNGNGEDGQGMLAMNDLTYVLSPDFTIAVNSTHKNTYFASNEYTNSQRSLCTWMSGADYVDTRSSFLCFSLKGIDSGKIASLESGSILNIIKNITISSRSGDEIARIQDFNKLANMVMPYKHNSLWFSTVGQSLAQGEYLFPDDHDKKYPHFAIPIYLLSDFFAYGRLMPAMLCSGLRVEIDWEDPVRAFAAKRADGKTPAFSGATALSSYTIVNPYFSLKCVQLTDGTQRTLNAMSATNGLEIVYTDWERTDYIGADTVAHIEVRKACSRALAAYARSRLKTVGQQVKALDDGSLEEKSAGVLALVNAPESNVDSFASENFDLVKYQWNLSSLYFPQQPVQSKLPQSNAPECYMHTLESFSALKPDNKYISVPLRSNTQGGYLQPIQAGDFSTATVGPEEYVYLEQNSTVTANSTESKTTTGRPGSQHGTIRSYMTDMCTIGCTLERSHLHNLTGVAVNNSRVLAFRGEFATAAPREITIFLKYVKLTRCFVTNCEVEQ